MKTFLPYNLNLKTHVLKHVPDGIPNFTIDKLAYFLSCVSSIPANNKKLEIKDGFVPMNATLLKKADYHYRKYLDYAVNTGILLENKQYIVKEKSHSFKFTPQYATKIIAHENTDQRFIRSMNRKLGHEIVVPKSLRHLANWFRSGDLNFDFEGAREVLDQRDNFYKTYPEKIPFSKQGDFWGEKKRKDPMQMYNSALFNFERLEAKDYHMSVDDTAGRLHTNLTNMPSWARNFLSFEGENLVSIDICNSQLYISTRILQPQFYFSEKIFGASRKTPSNSLKLEGFGGFTIDCVKPKIAKQVANLSNDIATLIMLVESDETYDGRAFQYYSTLCSEGKIYAHLKDQFSTKLGYHIEDSLVKRSVFQILFTHNRYIASKEARPKKLFSEEFLWVHEIFYQLKRKDKTLLPRLLQSMEAQLILHTICKRIHREKPWLPLFTVHDSIVTTVGHEEYVQKVMTEELSRNIGLPPTLRTEFWLPDKVKAF